MNIVVFGGGGFIGSAVCDRFLLDGHSVRVFERPRVEPYRGFSAHERVEWITGDLQSQHDVTQALLGMDVVVHLVSTTLPKSSNDDPIFDVQSNLVSTLRMLEAMVAAGTKKVLFISSGGTVYGDPRYIPIDEAHPTNPRVSYGITKLAIEKYLAVYGQLHGMKTVVLRVANPYGERQRVETAQGAVGVFIKKALLKEEIQIWGDGTVTRDYIHVSDVADAFAAALSYDGDELVFNIGSGEGASLNRLLEMIESLLTEKVLCQRMSARAFDVKTSILDTSLAEKELGWAPRIGLKEGLERTMRWFRKSLR